MPEGPRGGPVGLWELRGRDKEDQGQVHGKVAFTMGPKGWTA